jgi:hypothetical protein
MITDSRVSTHFAVASRTPRYFAAGHLAMALGANLYCYENRDTDFTDGKKAIRWNGERIDCNHLMVVGCKALRLAAKYIERGAYKTVAVVFSDTKCCTDYIWWNQFVKKNNVAVYMMPDLAQYSQVPYVPCYQTLIMPNIEIKKADRLTICHSPNKKGIWKGTPAIRRVIKELQKDYIFDYVEIIGKSWYESLEIKSRAHIFIDQLTYGNPEIPQKRFGGKITYNGALGKSGLEGMLLGCCTITGAKKVNTEPFFPTPPAIWRDKGEVGLRLLLTILFTDFPYGVKMFAVDVGKQQQEWAQKYTSPEFVTANLTRHINAIK